MKVVTVYNNFARGKIDHDMMGRFDLPIYQSGSDVLENFYTNFKGNAMYRQGFADMLGEAFQDCVFQEFRFRNDQNYLLVFYNTKIRFLSFDSNGNFGWVLDGMSNILEVTTPYTLAQCRDLQFSQNADVMVITHQSHPPKDLKRTAANAFTLTDHAFTDAGGSPFIQRVANITGITQANPAVVTSANHGFRDGDIVAIAGVVGMTQVNGNSYSIKVVNASSYQLVGIDSTGYTAYSSGGTATRAAGYPKCCLFYKGRLFFANTPIRSTTIWGSASGQYGSFDLPTTVTDTSPLQFTIAEITQPLEWLFGGDNSLIGGCADGIVAINGGGVGQAIKADTIEANLTSADGSNSSIPFKKDGMVFYVGQNDRNVYYFSYDLLTESFLAEDANFISYDITKGGMGKIRWKKDRNDLAYGVRGDGVLVSLNFKQKENIIGWHTQRTAGQFKDIAVITDNAGNPQLFALVLRNGAYYIERMADPVQFEQRVNFFTYDGSENPVEAKKRDDEAYNRYIAEQLRDCVYLDNASIVDNLQSNPIVFSGGNTITATNNVFTINDIGKHISYKTMTGYESGRFEIVGYTSAKIVTVNVLQEPTQNSYTDWYLSFSTVSGLDQYNGQTVGVVTDGGYLNDFEVSGGKIDFGSQVLSAVIGYTYAGIIKSFCLGFQVGAENTQTTMKAISRVGLRTVSSAGGKFGSSLYKLEPVQELSQNDINYLPPIPIDGTKYITYVDDAELDKFFYVVQDEPLPFTITSVMIDAQMAVTR
jgi:hypothetical protein